MSKGIGSTTEHTRASEQSTGNIQSLEKGLKILDAIIEAAAPVTLTDIVRRFEMDRASAFRFLQTLEQRGYLRKNAETKEYDVGGRVYYWASRLREKTSLIDSFHGHLQRLAAMTGQTAHLGMFVNDRVLLADFASSDSVIAIQHQIGGLEPLYCSAVGKAVLAALPEGRREELIEKASFVPLTSKTITNAQALREDLALTRERGFAIDDSETHDALSCVARAILGPDRMPIGSVGITCVTALVNSQLGRFDKIARAVVSTADEVTRLLSSRPVLNTGS
jgi:DNA-binding IclR family transcriptional regulator